MLYTSFTDKNILVSTARWAQEASPEVTESFSMLLLTDLLMPFEKGLDVLFVPHIYGTAYSFQPFFVNNSIKYGDTLA